MDAAETKRRLPMRELLSHYGREVNAHGWTRCLLPERHNHEDQRVSLRLNGERVTCWSQRCFENDDIFSVIGKLEHLPDFADQLRRAAEIAGLAPAVPRPTRSVHVNGTKEPPEEKALYEYTDETGSLLFQVVRYDPKDFRQRRPDGKGGWAWNLKNTRLVLYRLPDVVKAETVLIVEGEKDADAAYRLGLPEGWAATSNPMGAGKWRPEYSETLRGKRVVILPDTDEPGRRHAEQVAKSLEGKAFEILILVLPEGHKDLTEWSDTGGTAPAFRALLDNPPPFLFVSPPKNGPLHETNFAPLTASDFLDRNDEDEAIEWVLDEYLPVGGLALLVAKPKEGKSTLAYELAVKVAKGHPFLNRSTNGGAVLILGLEEHPRDMKLRLRSLGAGDPRTLYVYAGPLTLSPDTVERITRFTMEQHITLILVDSLAVFWTVKDENDAAEVTQAMKPLLRLARDTGACVLLIHHARKSEGSHGDEIRGSGALFAAVDVALIMKRHEVQTQRVLHAVSRYPETPTTLVLELRETGYCALGDPASLTKQAQQEKIKAALTDTFETPQTISQRAGIGYRATDRVLKTQAKCGEIEMDGKGRKNSPFRFRRHSIPAGPPPLGGTMKGIPSYETEEVYDLRDQGGD